MELTTLEELLDKYIGPIGSPNRDAYELELKEEIKKHRFEKWKKNLRKKKFKENLQKKK